jgi:protein-S-isoprenylcysteine O-methyltransferase Ste14
MIIGEFLLLLSGNVGQQYFNTASLASQTLAFISLTIAAFSSVFLIPRIAKEEKMLSESLGEEWRIYAGGVKWRLLPGIF